MAGAWLFTVLLLSKSLGAFALALFFCPVILFFSARAQTLVAAIFAAIVLLYPMMRSASLVPVDTIHSIAQSIDEKRANSLMTRFNNENQILEKASEKRLAGWGGWGRARVFDERGRDLTITDGYWVIIMSENGWLGYIARFGLMCIPLILLGLKGRKLNTTRVTSSLGIILCIGIVDLLLNATISPILWLITGSVMGRYQTADLRADNVQITQPARLESETREAPETRADAPPFPTATELHVRVPR